MADGFFRRVIAGLTLGVAVGLFAGEAVWPLQAASDVFIKLLQVTVLPYMIGSVIVGIGNRPTSDAAALARRGGAFLLLVWTAVLAWVFVSTLAYPPRASVGLYAGDAPPPTPIDWVDLYVPANVFHALANNLMPAVVLFSILAGIALSSMPADAKRPLLDVMEAFNEAMRRISRSIVRLTPFGLFAMAAAAAGTLRVEDFLRLQIWFVVFIGSASLLALWLLPSLVAVLTPIRYRQFVGSLRTALITAFAAGDHFVVLPMIVEANRALLVEQGVDPDEADGTVGVAVPLLFNFPHAGKLLALAFFPFAAWFAGIALGAGQWAILATAGLLSLFGSINAAVPFLLDLLRLPADLFNLFTVSSVLNQRFGALVAAMHVAVLSMLIAASLLGRLRFDARRLARTAIVSVVVLAGFVAATRLTFGYLLPPPPSGLAALEGFALRPGQPAAIVRDRDGSGVDPGPPGERLDRVVARGTIRVGFFRDGVPFAFFNPAGTLVGYDVEMANRLAAALGVTPEFVEIGRDEMVETLERGQCDVVMSGVVVTVPSAAAIDFSDHYHEERIGFLVSDFRRGEFARVADVVGRPLTLGAPSERLVEPIRRVLPRATVREVTIASVLESGELGGVDAIVMPIDQAFYLSRVQPALAAVVPEDNPIRALIAYALPRGAGSLREVVNTWVQMNRASGEFTSAYEYWVRGRGQRAHVPRWSIGHDVLGWW